MENFMEDKNWLNNNLIFQLVNLLPVSVFWKDNKGVYLGCNLNFTKALGLNSIEEALIIEMMIKRLFSLVIQN
jgi:hypothetical protein